MSDGLSDETRNIVRDHYAKVSTGNAGCAPGCCGAMPSDQSKMLGYSVAEMAEVVHHEDGIEAVTRRDEWVPVAVQRGFSAMCTEFVQAVRSGRRLKAADALESHRLCEQIVTETRRQSA